MFVALELVFVWVFASQNSYQRAKMVAASHWVVGGIEGVITSSGNYFSLQEENVKLLRENARLRSEIAELKVDTLLQRSAENIMEDYKVVKVVGGSFTKRNNFITISSGRNQGIVPDMALFNSDGIVGYVKYCSDNFSVAVSILNFTDFRTSGTITSESSPGSIYWDARTYREVVMDEISAHTPIAIGDTIVTTEYSNIFPAGLPVGIVTEVHEGYNQLIDARLELLADMSNLSYLYAVSLDGQRERAELEELTINH